MTLDYLLYFYSLQPWSLPYCDSNSDISVIQTLNQTLNIFWTDFHILLIVKRLFYRHYGHQSVSWQLTLDFPNEAWTNATLRSVSIILNKAQLENTVRWVVQSNCKYHHGKEITFLGFQDHHTCKRLSVKANEGFPVNHMHRCNRLTRTAFKHFFKRRKVHWLNLIISDCRFSSSRRILLKSPHSIKVKKVNFSE